MTHKAVLIFSGGQDSTTCLIQALHHYDEVHCITFDYGQRHKQEIEVAQKIAASLGVQHHKIIDAQVLSTLSISALTRDSIPVPQHIKEDEVPSTFVPGRNILFFTLAGIYAYQIGATTLITGVCDTDFSNYPDCRQDFVTQIQKALTLGMDYPLTLKTPLMSLTKAETWALADRYQKMDWVRKNTLTCYHGIIGDGCRSCIACELREKGRQSYLHAREETHRQCHQLEVLRHVPQGSADAPGAR